MELNTLVAASSSESDFDISKVIHFLYKDAYVCTNIKNNEWYELIYSKWVFCESAYSLHNKMSIEVAPKYCHLAAEMSTKAAIEDDNDIREKYVEKTKKLLEISLKLKNNAFKEKIIKECRYLFFVRDFKF
jgi:hypothetical protein